MADNKKNDDFVASMPDNSNSNNIGDGDKENDSLVGRGAGTDALPPSASGFMAKLEHSGPFSILAYCLSSISMTVVNKYVVSGTSWNLTFFYLAVQNTVCILAITACKKFGLIQSLAPLETDRIKKWYPISFVLVGMLYTGTKALQFLSVPVYTIFKNLTIIAIAYGEVLWFGGSVSPIALTSFGLMVLSSVVAAWADIKSAVAGDPNANTANGDALATLNAGYFWMALNVFCSASYVLGMRKVIKKMNFKDWDTMYYNNLLTIPVLVIFSILTEDWSSDNFAKNFPEESRNRITVGIIYSGLAAIFISYCTAWCIRVTSSTTYSMVGALNKLPIAISGLIFFAAPVTVGSVSAIFIGFVSGIVFTWAKVKESEAKKNALPTTEGNRDSSK
ncbi:GDP-mannose transporter [Fusarium albosuccineum]|uniref:GDP-mannose transporter n=1 Tax=Fusarium albosuccineum TaxID=1237068 RepID=A0A8H4LIB5_9HYPO|nr:GDP-mannose transporter [Fusarium albosuccineum]